MICKLIESSNHLCILFAIMKYMDDLSEKTLIEAKENNSAQVKLTPREQVSCTVPEVNDPFQGWYLLFKQREKRSARQTERTTRQRVTNLQLNMHG